MAKRSFAVARPIVVRQSAARPIIKVSAPRPIVARAKRAAHHFATRAANIAKEEKHRIGAVVAAGIVGYAEKKNINLPHVEAIGTAATYGLAGWLLLKSGHLKSKTLSHAVTGLLSVAAYQYTSGKGMSGVVLGLGGE